MHLGKCQLLSRVNCSRVWSGRGVIRAFVGEAAAVRTCVNFCVASSGTSKGSFFRGKAWEGQLRGVYMFVPCAVCLCVHVW